jgi:hypothetical protein
VSTKKSTFGWIANNGIGIGKMKMYVERRFTGGTQTLVSWNTKDYIANLCGGLD